MGKVSVGSRPQETFWSDGPGEERVAPLLGSGRQHRQATGRPVPRHGRQAGQSKVPPLGRWANANDTGTVDRRFLKGGLAWSRTLEGHGDRFMRNPLMRAPGLLRRFYPARICN